MDQQDIPTLDSFTENESHHVDQFKRRHYLTSSTIIGMKVANYAGESLGRIHEVMIDIKESSIAYFVIEFGGFLGMGEKYFALPFRSLIIDVPRKLFILDQSPEVLKNAPSFDKAHWPDTNAHELQSSTVYWEGFTSEHRDS